MFFNLPTLLTWGRIVSIPLVVGVYYLNLEPATQNILGTTLFIVVSQVKINLTNAYAGSLAWSNFFARLTHSHPGRVEWMAQIGASRSVAVHMVGKVKTVVQMIAIPFLLYYDVLFGVIDTAKWGTVLIWISAFLTIWSMVYYLQKALPEIRARVR